MANGNIGPINPFSQEFLSHQNPKNNFLKIIGILVIIGVAGAAVSLATQIWDPLWNPFRLSPEAVIEKMTEKMAAVQTIHSNIDFEITIKNETEFDLKINTRADTDTTDPENLKTEQGLDFNITSEGMQFILGLESKSIDDASYFRITNIPTALLMGMGIDVGQIKNVWIKIEEDSFKELLGEEAVQQIQEESEKSGKQQKETIEKLKNLIENKKFYTVKKELPDEKINEIKVYHYLVSLNKEEIKNILPELLKIFGEQESQSLLPGEIEGLKQEFDKFFEKVGDLNGELWIGKKDKLLYKFKGEKSIDASQFTEGTKGTVSLKLNIDFSNFNQPIQIEAPKDFKTFEEIFSPILGPLIKDPIIAAKQREKDARIKADMSQMRSAAEIIGVHNNSYSEVSCQETDKGIKALCDDIAGYTGKKPTIYSSSKHYCVYTELLLKDESGRKIYFCTDDSLKMVQTTIFPGGKGYCDGKTFTCSPATPATK